MSRGVQVQCRFLQLRLMSTAVLHLQAFLAGDQFSFLEYKVDEQPAQAAPYRGLVCGNAASAPRTTNRVRACSGGSSKRGDLFVQLCCLPALHLFLKIACDCNATVQVLLEKFQTASFAELCSITMANKPAESLYHCLNDIYGRSGLLNQFWSL